MSVYKKLMEARIALQGKKMTKSGLNKFAGFSYFELSDFLPTVQQIFAEMGLCGTVSFATDIATLTITDVEDGSQITITSPMAEANLKGCHPIQNLGAVETYTRRYLWVTAMEIVEHDVLDSTTGKATGGDDEAFEAKWLPVMREAAMNGLKALEEAFKQMPNNQSRKDFWIKHQESLKAAANGTT